MRLGPLLLLLGVLLAYTMVGYKCRWCPKVASSRKEIKVHQNLCVYQGIARQSKNVGSSEVSTL